LDARFVHLEKELGSTDEVASATSDDVTTSPFQRFSGQLSARTFGNDSSIDRITGRAGARVSCTRTARRRRFSASKITDCLFSFSVHNGAHAFISRNLYVDAPPTMVETSLRMEPGELRETRTLLGLSQEQLAALLGVNRLSVLRWEGGLRRIPGMLPLALEALIERRIQFITGHDAKNRRTIGFKP
jgi:DNA-binding transcriptional regulator YiaG